MPKLDFDTISMGHGSGGSMTHRLLDSGVFALLGNEQLDRQHDGAELILSGRTAFTTDSYVVSPIFFPGGNIGSLAVHGTLNDLAMCGAKPRFLSLGLILEEGLAMTDLWEVLVSIRDACQAAGVQVVTGDTKVVDRGKGDQIFINTTGLGEVHPDADIRMERVQPGDQVIVSGPLAAHGITIMAQREGLGFEADIQSDSQPLHEPVSQLLDELGAGIHLLRDATRGGLGTIMVEVARQAGLGIDLRQRDIPVAEAVASACELLGLDPLYVANEGVFMAIVAPEVAEAAVALMRQHPACAEASIIGEITQAHPRQVVMASRIGGRRVVNMLAGEQLPRIC
jgi:hydrogenase expression/formation protein HypE